MNEVNGWQGTFDVYIRDQNGEMILDKTIKNTVTDSGLNFLRDLLRGTQTDGTIKYIAVGTSSASVSTSDTQLGAEYIRKGVSRTAGSTGQLLTIGILEDSEAITQIEEIGVFAGSTASTASNSGIMISRVLYSRNKTSLESIQIQRTDTITRS